jgi:flagellar biosynthetic protein FliO
MRDDATQHGCQRRAAEPMGGFHRLALAGLSCLCWATICPGQTPPEAAGSGAGQLLRSGRLAIPPVGPDAPANGDVSAESVSPADRAGEGYGGLALPLQQSAGNDAQAEAAPAGGLLSGGVTSIVGALAITLGLFCCFVALMRRTSWGRSQRSLPKQAMEVVGQLAIGPRQQLLVVRCGSSALVLGVSPAGIQTVAQFDDAEAAGSFLAHCRGQSAAASFRSTLADLEREPHPPGFVEDDPERNAQHGKRLFLRA